MVSLCSRKICQITNAIDLQYQLSSRCDTPPTHNVDTNLYYKYPYEVFLDDSGDTFFAKNLKTPHIVAKIYRSKSDVASIVLRNSEALNRLVDALNKETSGSKTSVRVLKLKTYPIGTVFYQQTAKGFEKVTVRDIQWEECSTVIH